MLFLNLLIVFNTGVIQLILLAQSFFFTIYIVNEIPKLTTKVVGIWTVPVIFIPFIIIDLIIINESLPLFTLVANVDLINMDAVIETIQHYHKVNSLKYETHVFLQLKNLKKIKNNNNFNKNY